MTYLDIGIVGHGAVATAHAGAFASIGGVRVTAVLGRDRARADPFASAVGATAHDDIDRFSVGLDAAVIASPTPDHAAQGLALVERGIDVLIELPAAPDVASLDAVIAAAASGGGRVFATHTVRFLPASLLIAELVASGRLGEIGSVEIDRRVARRERPWRDDPLLHHGQHAIDALTFWFGDVDVAAAKIGGQRARVELVADGPIPAHVSMTHDAPMDWMRVSVVGSDGAVVTDGFGSASADLPLDWTDSDRQDAYLRAISTQDHAFVAAIRGAENYPDIGVTRRNTELVEQARRIAVGST